MHPAMYEDRWEKSTSRCSQRLISAKETRPILPSRKPEPQTFSESSTSGSPSDRENEGSFWGYNFKRKRTPVGRSFQAKIPEWTQNAAYEPDTRYLGTLVWPLGKGKTQNDLVEREPICRCQLSCSSECVRFHINEKRNTMKLELGPAFYKWKFNDMGESIVWRWTRPDEKKFEDIIKSTPASSGVSFWDKILDHFKSKTMRVLVSYYYNVYLLRRRAHQNRADSSNIDSDDDELEKVANGANNNSIGSFLCSPKKAHLKVR